MAMVPLRFKRITAAFDDLARARLCESSGSEHSAAESSAADLSDLVNSFLEREGNEVELRDDEHEEETDKKKKKKKKKKSSEGEEGVEPERCSFDSEAKEVLMSLVGGGKVEEEGEDSPLKRMVCAEVEKACRSLLDQGVAAEGFKRRVMTSLRQRGFDAGITSFPRRDALGEIKDEAEDKFDEDTWFSADEKRNEMTKESIVELLKEYPLPLPFSARSDKGGPKSNKGWHSRYFFVQRPSGKWEFPRRWNGFCKDYEKKGFLATDATTKKLIDPIKRRGGLNIDEPLTDHEMRHAGLIPPAPTMPVPPTPIVESPVVLGHTTQVLAIGTLSSRTPSLGLLEKASKGKRKEVAGEGSSPRLKKRRTPTSPMPPLVVEDLPINKDPIFCPRWTIKRGDSRMPSSHVSAQYLAHGVLPSDKLILENQPHEAFAMSHVQVAYNAYCYSSQMQDRFAMAMDVARKAKTNKRAAEGKAGLLDKEVKNLKMENTDLLAKLGRLKKKDARS
ncbi:hypothetical protein RJ639_027550 [Escallonia herrerae]|uniref:Uncharacterized protein n=1 Tax=Escallonia herrerae TaxID=1293975 RepID=A0AA88X2W3_9ASTE|nr:hypothetical protein RJ639_027550 [Escallonia herrerae]